MYVSSAVSGSCARCCVCRIRDLPWDIINRQSADRKLSQRPPQTRPRPYLPTRRGGPPPSMLCVPSDGPPHLPRCVPKERSHPPPRGQSVPADLATFSYATVDCLKRSGSSGSTKTRPPHCLSGAVFHRTARLPKSPSGERVEIVAGCGGLHLSQLAAVSVSSFQCASWLRRLLLREPTPWRPAGCENIVTDSSDILLQCTERV